MRPEEKERRREGEKERRREGKGRGGEKVERNREEEWQRKAKN